VATAGMNLYAVFDFLTFQETLEDGQAIQDQDLKFALQSNARLPILMLATGQVIFLICSYLIKLLTDLKPELFTNIGFVFVFASWLALIFSEDSKQKISISYIITGQTFIFIGYGLGSISSRN
jgi:hypothetical protein